jgi:hypothetical protein
VCFSLLFFFARISQISPPRPCPPAPIILRVLYFADKSHNFTTLSFIVCFLF